MLNVYIDGACQPINPGGTASYGLVILREHPEEYAYTGIDMEEVYKEGKVIGSGSLMSNNVAEYSALLRFLEWYHCNIKENEKVLIHSDSQLLVNQMKGLWNINSGKLYTKYAIQAKTIFTETNPNLEFKWIPREENTEADNLSKEAILKGML